ncbi:VOC family protein [Bacillus kexueae]|uniref:SMU1112c/YaeR family gloxylase I-like metalloprotein n=1 Tax=Aeribacillus kexueae TaxID=2078952 RepID=UPI001FAFA88F|nr:VOC family protein [Bacillus kexueae]
MLLSSIHHVAIICSNYEKSKQFYVDILGLEVIHEEYRKERDSYKLDLRIGDHSQLELFSFPNPPKRPSYPEACGLRHLAFRVDDIQQVCQKLTEHGIEVESIRVDPITNKRYTFFQDPDGLPLELYEE